VGNLIAALAACCIILPGFLISIPLRRSHLCGSLLLTALFGLLIASLPVWLPPARFLSVQSWTVILFYLSAASALVLLFSAFNWLGQNAWTVYIKRQRFKVSLIFSLPWIFLACGYISILVTRPIFEWDAVSYYLPAAQNYVELNHFSNTFSQAFNIGNQVPVDAPPLIPWLYALGIEIGAILHQPADRAIRLIPFIFLLIFWLATNEIAHAILPRKFAKYASLLTAALPLLILNVVAQAFYLDIPIAACFVALIAAITSKQRSATPIVVGAWALLTVLTKITGLPLVMLLICCFAAYSLGGIKGRLAILMSIGFLILASAKLMVLLNFEGMMQWILLAFATVALWCAIPERTGTTKLDVRAYCLAALVFFPGGWYLVERAKTFGGLPEYYLLLAGAHSPNFYWAQTLIQESGLLDTYVPPDIRQHLGVGVLLWWGFSPVVMLFACLGALLAIKHKSRARFFIVASIMLIVLWITMFHSRDYRHILPILAFESVFALYAVQKLFVRVRATANFVIVCLFWITMPLTWIAQQKIYASPISPELFNQDAAWTSKILVVTFVGTIACSMLLFSLSFAKHRPFVSARAPFMDKSWVLLFWIAAAFAVASVLLSRSTTAIIATNVTLVSLFAAGALTLLRRKHRGFWILSSLCATIICSFEPLIATGTSVHFSDNSKQITDREFIGYIPALRKATVQRGNSILSFLTYGVSWFSEAKVRPINLLNPVDLAHLRSLLSSGDVTKLVLAMNQLGVRSAIFPAAGKNFYYRGFYDFLNKAGLKSVQGLSDPLFSSVYGINGWEVLALEPNSGLTAPCGLALQISRDNAAPRSLEHSNGLNITVPRPVIQIALRKCVESSRAATIEILYKVGEERNELRRYSQHFTFPVRSSQHIIRVLLAKLLSGNASATMLIKSIRLSITDKYARVSFVNWRSPHFTVTYAASSRQSTLSGDVFVYRPEHALISYVSFENEKGDGLSELRLYPRPLTTFGYLNGTLTLYSKIVTRESFDCPLHAPLSITLKATVLASDKTLSVQKSIRSEVGNTVLVNINRWLDELAVKHSEVQWIRFSQISARGLSNGRSQPASYCLAQETLGAPHITLVRTNSKETGFIVTAFSLLPGTEALDIDDVN